ncbi:NACHT domain-containing protein [Nocardia sp. NBC_01730]|uniref:NACHT domain-containing protein n=1 Tax=Nocardia sp. NBC_01730 TaxID=2975998 RepID=UPI002E0FDB1E|nr:NACHT domain-containing protein [Nocardia sp. NBC_01730]
MAFVSWLVLRLTQEDLERGSWLAGIVSMWVAVVGFPLAVVALVVAVWQGRRTPAHHDSSGQLDELTETLAAAVRALWRDEETVRRVHDSLPMETRWDNGPDHLADHWENIHGSAERHTPIDLSGRLDQIVDVFQRIPSGRIVVLGKGGAGKTILASRFVLDSLERRIPRSRQPVPVLFSVYSWNPTAIPLRLWLVDQLVEIISPQLTGEDAVGKSFAARLLDDQRIIPVLDGFDEINKKLRAAAIRGINAALRPGDRLLLTSRLDEYESVVPAEDVLSAAAVVQLADLTPDQITEYLPLTTPKNLGGQTKWHPVLARARAQPRYTVLLDVLSTPLMIMLARTIFSETDADPAVLLAILDQRVADPADDRRRALEHRLLDGFVPAVYSRIYRTQVPGLRKHYNADDANKWLGFLARHVKRRNTNELVWWQLIYAVPRTIVGLVAGSIIALTVWPVIGITGWVGEWRGSDGQLAWLTATLVSGVVSGVVGGILVGRGRGIRRTPARVRLRAKGRVGEIVQDLSRRLRSWRTLAWIIVWTAGGTFFGVAAAPVMETYNVIPVGSAAGVFAGSGIWLVVTFIRAMGVPVDPTETVSPADLLHTDRVTALRQGLGIGVGGASVFWCMMWFAFERAFGLPFDAVLGDGRWALGWLATMYAGLLSWVLFFPVWGPWFIARVYLPLGRKLPWGVMAFLDDAHRSGVLRQVGGVYEFRHIQLRDHLATPSS